MKKYLFSTFVLFINLALSFAQNELPIEILDFQNIGIDLEFPNKETDADKLIIDQRLSSYVNYEEHSVHDTGDSLKYIYAHVEDSLFVAIERYKLLDAEWVYAGIDSLEYDAQNRLRKINRYDFDEDIYILTSHDNISYTTSGNYVKLRQDFIEGDWVNVQKEEVDYHPNQKTQRIAHYNWNSESNTWQVIDLKRFTENGKELEKIHFFSPTHGARSIYSREANDLLLSYTYQSWDSLLSDFTNKSHSVFLYDDEDKIHLKLRYEWNASTGNWNYIGKSVYQYDYFNTNLIHVITTLDSVAPNTYVNKLETTYNYNENDKLQTTYISFWNTNVSPPRWESSRTHNYEFDDNNRLIEKWIGTGYFNVPYTRNIYAYNEQGNMTESHFYGYNGSWTPVFHTYKNWYYEDYETGTVGVKEYKPLHKIFPNPTSNTISFEFEEKIIEASLTVYSVTGKQVLFKNNWTGTILDVTRFSPGIYYYILRGKNIQMSGKFVKQQP